MSGIASTPNVVATTSPTSPSATGSPLVVENFEVELLVVQDVRPRPASHSHSELASSVTP